MTHRVRLSHSTLSIGVNGVQPMTFYPGRVEDSKSSCRWIRLRHCIYFGYMVCAGRSNRAQKTGKTSGKFGDAKIPGLL